MPIKRKKSEKVPGVAGVTIPPELLDQLVKGPMTPEEVQAWRTYRQQLRDVTSQPDPFNIVWPTPPSYTQGTEA